MRSSVGAMLFFLAGIALFPQCALAQDASWTGGAGRYALNYESGWSPLPEERMPPIAHLVFAVEHTRFQAESRQLRTCWVIENPLGLPEALTQEAANGLVATYFARPESAAGETLALLGEQNGVQLVAGEKDQNGMRRRTRRFFLATSGAVTEVIATCSIRMPATDAETASADRILESLTIGPTP